MNASPPILEPRWATYLKALAFVAPALVSWAIFVTRVFPSLNQIVRDPHVELPETFSRLAGFNAAIMLSVKEYALPLFLVLLMVLVLLEWRSKNWPRFRRATLGTGVFALNCAALVSFFLAILTATLAASSLYHHLQ